MNVLVDLDGTLTDPRNGILGCIRHALVRLSRTVPSNEALRRYIGPPLTDSFRELLGTDDPVLIDEAVAIYRERFSSSGIFENVVYEGIPAALSRLVERGAELYVATLKPRVFAERIVRHFGLARYFRAVYGSELDGTRASKTDLIGYILARERLSSAVTAMVGDRGHDIDGARANGIVPIGVLWGYGSAEELTIAGSTRLLKEPEELGELVI